MTSPSIERFIEWFQRSRRRLATVSIGVLALLLGAQLVFGTNGWRTYSQKRDHHEKLQKEIQAIQQENERLQQQIKELKTDPKAIEKEAREQLKYTRPGEVVYTLPSPPAQKPATSTAQR